MIIDLPSSNTSAVNRKLVELRESGGVFALGRVLTLVVVTDDGPSLEQAVEAANQASREHPCRVIVLARGQRRAAARLDAQIRVGGDAGASEVVVLRGYGALAEEDAGAGMVMPLLLPDAPVVAWWPGEAPAKPAEDAIGRLAQRRITDALAAKNPTKAFEQRRKDHQAGDTDLVWTRLTHWRAQLAAALDVPPFDDVTSAVVAGEAVSPSTELLAGWLASALGIKVKRSTVDDRGKAEGLALVRLTRASGTIELVRPDGRTARLTQPGQPERRIALARRGVPDCLVEELRRLDPDEIYHEALDGISQITRGRTPVKVDFMIAVHPDADVLASAVAARLVTTLIDVQAAGRVPRIVLTGGGVGIDLLRKLRDLPAQSAVDWSRVEFFWGDERFVAPDDPERNDLQAREALLDHVPVDPALVHPMGADTGASTASDAAAEYAALLGEDPHFDVVLLGMGGEGHTLSVFPDSPAVHDTSNTVVAVYDCPKPPPTRVSLTLPVLAHADEAWVVAAGSAKAEAVAGAVGGKPETELPVAGAGRAKLTRWLLDRDAASQLHLA